MEFIIDIVIENPFVGITVDKGFYRDGFNKITIYFSDLKIHVKMNDVDLKRFKEFSLS